MLRLRTPPPEVRLVNTFARPFDNAIATARTCYSAKGIVSAEEVGGDALPTPESRAKALARRDELGRSLYQAGHHTVFEHAHFQFTLDRVSRHALWVFFHAHPFYDSEQVSQRYVTVGPGAALVPELGGRAQAVYERTLARLEQLYEQLTARLTPAATELYFGVHRARRRRPDRWRTEIQRKAQEAARYVLPVATWARLYHTISGVTLLRYRRLAEQLDTPSEVRLVVDAMVAEVERVDPAYGAILEAPMPLEETPEFTALTALGGVVDPARAALFRAEFDGELAGRVSRLVSWSSNAESVVAQAVRDALGAPRGQMTDDDALALAADPSKNPVFGEALNLIDMGRLTRALHHPHYTFRKKLSHTADSQNQRHRTTPASRPALLAHLGDEPDVVTPELVQQDPEARRIFDEAMAAAWEGLRELRRLGAPDEAAIYLSPNAIAVRFTESADYAALRHKLAMRLCYNAQEEIWRASLDEALQVNEVHPRLGKFLLPPCTLRLLAQTSPYCPEGSRYCGVPVWRLERAEYRRAL